MAIKNILAAQKRRLVGFASFVASLFVMFQYQNCTQAPAGFTPSANQAQSLAGPAFAGPNSEVANVVGADGNPAENLRISSVADVGNLFTQDCTATTTPYIDCSGMGPGITRQACEKQLAQQAAANDPNQKTIPVEIALSFGQKTDILAAWAHDRAILSDRTPASAFPDGQSVIPVGQADATDYSANGQHYNAYYVVDSSQVKQDVRYGKRCYYDTVTILNSMVKEQPSYSTGGTHYKFVTNQVSDSTNAHMIHFMYYGWCASTTCASSASAYGADDTGNDMHPNRLFGAWPYKATTAGGVTEYQIVKLYVADLRDAHFGLPGTIVNTPDNTARGQEVQLNTKQQLALKEIFRNRDLVIRNLSSTFQGTYGTFAGMQGVPQLISNIILAGTDNTVLASQYTPIVLDLGAPGVLTSSTFGGTFFNMAALKSSNPATLGTLSQYDYPQQTSWIGGNLVDVSLTQTFPPSSFTADVRRVAEDGFLVITDSDGQVRSSLNLFGNNMVVNGQTYANGFLALQALAGKDCTSSDLTKQYLGPWDGDLYNSKIMVWVDANRNGTVDPGELQTLKQAGVVAIDTCNIVSKQETDAFGNGTSLRSAFLFQSGEDITGNQGEILTRLSTGLTSTGAPASFRLAIDLIFNVVTANTLDPYAPVTPAPSTPSISAASTKTASTTNPSK